MRNRTFALLFWFVVLTCGMAAAQEPPALTPKNPIPLTKVEGRLHTPEYGHPKSDFHVGRFLE
jgi:hypothetical protein